MELSLFQISIWYVGFPLFIIAIGWTNYHETAFCHAIKKHAPEYYEHIGRPGQFEFNVHNYMSASTFRNKAMFGWPENFPDTPALTTMLEKHHRNNKLLFGCFATMFLLSITSLVIA